MSPFDTIVAPITGAGPAAVAAVRISGPEAFAVAAKVFSPFDAPEPMRARYGKFHHGDDGLALPFAAGHSYTGDETVELFVHGSPVSVRLLIEGCLAAGARMAEPGEFTQRAFLNGRIDLAQAESVAETIAAQSEAHFRRATENLSGALSREIRTLREAALTELAHLEASVDFSEEIGEYDLSRAKDMFSHGFGVLGRLLESASGSRILRSGFRVSLAGRPNAGKSSLLNALLRSDRAIVTEIPGTTRDVIREAIEIEGVQVILSDTAGLRDTADAVEEIGISRTGEEIASADLTLYLYDGSLGWTPEDERWCPKECVWRIATKCDLPAFQPTDDRRLSTVTGEGIPEILAELARMLEELTPPILITDRHREHLMAAEGFALEGLTVSCLVTTPDLVSVCLNEYINALGKISGETSGPDMLTEIFSRFCLGK